MAVVFSLQWSVALGQAPAGFPGVPLESRTIRIQTRVEELFVRREYVRAHFIYRNELAVVGDKYAQYMVGFMYLTGKGVQKDAVTASAWYRLAAERQAPEFVAARDRLMSTFDAVDVGRSDQAFIALCLQYSDLVMMLKLARKDLTMLSETSAGSRLSGGSRSIVIINPSLGNFVSSDQYFRRISKRLQSRLDFITDGIEIDKVDANGVADELIALQQQVLQYLKTVGDR
ncbi:MAG: hypothetical protein V3S15_09920 [Woeseiaceae bacterium]